MTLPSTTLVLDACTTITFARVKRLDIVAGIPGIRVVIAARALAEVKKQPAKDMIAKAIRNNLIAVASISLEDPAEAAALATYDGDHRFRETGEAEVLALAVARRYVGGSDEHIVREAAEAALGKGYALQTVNLMKIAVVDGRLTVDEAVSVFESMDVAPTYMRALARLGMGTPRDFFNLR